MNNKTKKEIGVFIIVICFLMLIFPSIKIVKGAVSNVIAHPGAVNCIIEFDCGAGDIIYIKYGENYPLQWKSYTDPDDMNGNDRTDNTHRWIILRSLEENTAYKYEIWTGGVNDTMGTFTTLSRFTIEYVDEFLDTYQWDNSSNINIYQSDGLRKPYTTAHGLDGLWELSAVADGPHLVINRNGTKDLYTCSVPSINQKLLMNWNMSYIDSSDYSVVLSMPPGYKILSPIWDDQNNIWFSTLYAATYGFGIAWTNDVGNWDQHYATVFTSNFADIQSDEMGLGPYIDYLGANGYGDYSNRHVKAIDDRQVGWFIGFNKTSWLGLSNSTSGIDRYGVYSGTLRLGDYFYTQGGEAKNDSYSTYSKCRNGIYVNLWNCLAEATDNTMGIYLASSRDGISWHFINTSKELVPKGEGASWDNQSIWYGKLVWDNDTDYITYLGCNNIHCNPPCSRQIGLIKFRHEGLTYVGANTSSGGWLRTTTIDKQFRRNLTINGNFTDLSRLKISVMYANNDTVIPRFSNSNFNMIKTNSTEIPTYWGANTLSNLPYIDFKLNFTFEGDTTGKLFSYHIQTGNYTVNSTIPVFLSIGGGGNGTHFSNPKPEFIWNRISNVSFYILQIANDSIFTDIIFNFSVNQYVYPYHYSINSTSVIFTLPMNLPYKRMYYARVLANVKQ